MAIRRRLFSTLSSFIEYPHLHEFSIDNIPFGSAKFKTTKIKFCCTRIGDYVIDLTELEKDGVLEQIGKHRIFRKGTLNKFMEAGTKERVRVRERLQEMFCQPSQKEKLLKYMFDSNLVELQLPAKTRNVVHFVTSKHSVEAQGRLLKADRSNPLPERFFDIPLGHNGRSAAIQVDSKVYRPFGYMRKPDDKFGESTLFDYSLGLGFYIGGKRNVIDDITYNTALDRVFGFSLVNSWTAHDLYAFEVLPDGPLNSKNFATSVSPWVITPEALKPFEIRIKDPANTPSKHISFTSRTLYDIALTMKIKGKDESIEEITSSSNMREMYWTPAQLVLHQLASGIDLVAGDLNCSGTLTSRKPKGNGCLLEKTNNGSKFWELGSSKRSYLEIGDEVIMEGKAQMENLKIGFGNSRVTVQSKKRLFITNRL